MNTEFTILTAILGVITSGITAYITTRLKLREEHEKWRRDFAAKFAEMQATNSLHAEKMSVQFAIGFLIKNADSENRERIFIPPHCRLVAGREKTNAIVTDRKSARQHCTFQAEGSDVFIEELGSPNGTFINGQRLEDRQKLITGDVVQVGETTLRFQKLNSSNA